MKMSLNLCFVDCLLLTKESSRKCDWYSRWNFTGKNWYLPSWWISVADSFLVGGGSLCLHPPLMVVTLSGLNPGQALCLLPQSLSVHMCISLGSERHSSVDIIYGLQFSQLFYLLLRIDPYPWRESFDKDSDLGARAPRSFTFCSLSYCGNLF